MVVQRKILVVIPARNEEKFIGKTVEVLGEQNPKPTKVIIIDDGSTDKTSQIAKKAAEKAELNFEIINRKDRGFAALGLATLANVYNDGFNAVNLKDFDFMVVNGA
ncbi:MAG: glycosyltransferase family A protein, partial [Candidatus Heimdallarchaeota archaeon]